MDVQELKPMFQKLGIADNGDVYRIINTRDKFKAFCQLGSPALPDFTLHNVNHSDNLINILCNLKAKLKFQLNPREAYLLVTSVYLHDLGMFFDPSRFRKELLNNFKITLQPLLCKPDNEQKNTPCDSLDNYLVSNMPESEQIRSIHHLLSVYMFRNNPTSFGIESDDVKYLNPICRGHRKTNLNTDEISCNCYGDIKNVRIALLATLLRISDEFDFEANRAPRELFDHAAYRFLEKPESLSHWIKHRLIDDPKIVFPKGKSGKGNILRCNVTIQIPNDLLLNGVDYKSFFKAFYEYQIKGANQNLDKKLLPSQVLRDLKIDGIEIILSGYSDAGIQALLPEPIREQITKTQSVDWESFEIELKKSHSKDEVNQVENQEELVNTENEITSTTLNAINNFSAVNSTSELRKLLEEGKEKEIILAPVEFEGPFTVFQPISIRTKGGRAILSSKEGPVINILSDWLRLENIDLQSPDSPIQFETLQSYKNLEFINVTIRIAP